MIVERAIAWHPGGGLALANSRDVLTMRAELPPIPAADRALAEIKAGRVDGLSVEFRAVRERRDGDIRVIEDAVLSGIGIVRAPSYDGSRVEARRRSGRTMRARIPADRSVECRCSGAECKFAKMAKEGHGAGVQFGIPAIRARGGRRFRELRHAPRLGIVRHACAGEFSATAMARSR